GVLLPVIPYLRQGQAHRAEQGASLAGVLLPIILYLLTALDDANPLTVRQAKIFLDGRVREQFKVISILNSRNFLEDARRSLARILQFSLDGGIVVVLRDEILIIRQRRLQQLHAYLQRVRLVEHLFVAQFDEVIDGPPCLAEIGFGPL